MASGLSEHLRVLNAPPAEAEYTFYYKIAERELKAGKTIEDTMILLRESVRETYTDERFLHSIAWIFRRDLPGNKLTAKKSFEGAEDVLDKYFKKFNALEVLKVHVISVDTRSAHPEIVHATIMLFGALQYMRVFPMVRRKNTIIQVGSILFVFIVAACLLGFGIGLAIFLAFGGGESTISIVLTITGAVGVYYAVKNWINFRSALRKFSA